MARSERAEVEELGENLVGRSDSGVPQLPANVYSLGVQLISGIEQGDPVTGVGEDDTHQLRLGAAYK